MATASPYGCAATDSKFRANRRHGRACCHAALPCLLLALMLLPASSCQLFASKRRSDVDFQAKRAGRQLNFLSLAFGAGMLNCGGISPGNHSKNAPAWFI